LGATASLRDIRDVAQGDWLRIRLFVPFGVFLVLWLLLRRPFVSGYLVLTVTFSFLVTYGVTYLLFSGLDPAFPGIDWTVSVAKHLPAQAAVARLSTTNPPEHAREYDKGV
jgi:RND superfamily putative drug exporter